MTTVSDNHIPISSPPQVPTTDAAASLPTNGSSNAPLTSDPERQNFPHIMAGRPKPNFLTRIANVFLLPFNMWAPLPDYYLEQQLLNHPDELIQHDLYKVLIGAQDLRTQQWRLAYWIITVSLFCTVGTALIGMATAIVSFNNQPLAQKILSILVATFGVILSLLKGTGMPANAFITVNAINDIIDCIEDLHLSGDKFDTTRVNQIKTNWRAVRDGNITEQSTIWKNIQK